MGSSDPTVCIVNSKNERASNGTTRIFLIWSYTALRLFNPISSASKDVSCFSCERGSNHFCSKPIARSITLLFYRSSARFLARWSCFVNMKSGIVNKSGGANHEPHQGTPD